MAIGDPRALNQEVADWGWTVRAPPPSKFISLALVDEADDAGFCEATDEHVARKCDMSQEKYLKNLRLLESPTLVAIEHREDHARRCTLSLP